LISWRRIFWRGWLVICGLWVTFWLLFWVHLFMRAGSAFDRGG
jgi:hypothetical protein